jgi:hypothetical protein
MTRLPSPDEATPPRLDSPRLRSVAPTSIDGKVPTRSISATSSRAASIDPSSIRKPHDRSQDVLERAEHFRLAAVNQAIAGHDETKRIGGGHLRPRRHGYPDST